MDQIKHRIWELITDLDKDFAGKREKLRLQRFAQFLHSNYRLEVIEYAVRRALVELSYFPSYKNMRDICEEVKSNLVVKKKQPTSVVNKYQSPCPRCKPSFEGYLMLPIKRGEHLSSPERVEARCRKIGISLDDALEVYAWWEKGEYHELMGKKVDKPMVTIKEELS